MNAFGGSWIDRPFPITHRDRYRYPLNGTNKLRAADRPFMAWDGEGVNHLPGTPFGDATMSYVLFGCTNAAGVTEYITGERLGTEQLLTFMYDTACEHRNHINVTFGFSFDVDQILRDVEPEMLFSLREMHTIVWNDWRITFIPRKFFRLQRVNRGPGKGNAKVHGNIITWYDTISFFQTTLIKAARKYVTDPALHATIPIVEMGKKGRKSFRYDELHTQILPYWKLEGALFVGVMDALRNSLRGAKIELEQWHGPGAVASALIKRERLVTHIQKSRDNMPEEVREATSYAFFGGRFEAAIIGRIPGPIHAYDIRSAYPAALSRMPGLTGGHWKRTTDVTEWGIYRYEYEPIINDPLGFGPLPNRAENDTVSYALSGSGWAYGHEIVAAGLTGWDINVRDGWAYVEASDYAPFSFLQEMYLRRAELIKEHNPAQMALKLGPNSLYGKLAQLVGYRDGKPPQYHHPWYSGHTTSWCRARLYLAMMQEPDDMIAVETDGIYSRVPLKLRIGPRLGEWEHTVYDEMVYVQSGLYIARQGSCLEPSCVHDYLDDDGEIERVPGCGWTTIRSRGMSVGNVSVAAVLAAEPSLDPISTSVTRYAALTGFIGHDRHYKWYTEPRLAVWGGNEKRRHSEFACPGCIAPDIEPHRTVISHPHASFSAPRRIPWDHEPFDIPDDETRGVSLELDEIR